MTQPSGSDESDGGGSGDGHADNTSSTKLFRVEYSDGDAEEYDIVQVRVMEAGREG